MYTKESPCLCSKYAKKLALTPRSTCVQTPYTPKKKSVEGQQLMASLPYPPSVSRAKRRLHQHAKKVLAKVRKYAACLIQNVVAFYLEFSHLRPLLPPGPPIPLLTHVYARVQSSCKRKWKKFGIAIIFIITYIICWAPPPRRSRKCEH